MKIFMETSRNDGAYLFTVYINILIYFYDNIYLYVWQFFFTSLRLSFIKKSQ
jgi:hypothetical protein